MATTWVVQARSADRFDDRDVLDRVAGTAYGDLADLDDTVAVARQLDEHGRFERSSTTPAPWTGRSPFP
jgi:hypothetical protein